MTILEDSIGKFTTQMCCNVLYKIRLGEIKFCRRCMEMVNSLDELEGIKDEKDN